MTVYADVLFALNTCVNYLMLLVSARVAGAHIRRVRLALAGGLGGLYAVAALLPGLGVLQGVWMKALVWAAMLVVAFGATKKTLRLGLLFLAASFAFGGVVFALMQLLGAGVMVLPGGAFYPVSAGALLTLAGVTYLAAWLVFSRLGEHTGGQIVTLTLSLGAHSVTVRALHDSGNTLKDPITNEPVLVASWQTAAQLLPEANLQQAEFSDPAALLRRLAEQNPALRLRLVPYRAVGTQSGLLLAARCTAGQAGRRRPALVAFSPTSVSDAGNYEALTGG